MAERRRDDNLQGAVAVAVGNGSAQISDYSPIASMIRIITLTKQPATPSSGHAPVEGAGAPEVWEAPITWDGSFQSLKPPAGLTEERARAAARLIISWSEGDEPSALPLVLALYRLLLDGDPSQSGGGKD